MPIAIREIPRRITRARTYTSPPDEADRDSATGIDWSQSAILGHRSAAARDLADLAATRMLGSTLPWTQRQFLLHQATRRNIGRFEANLIIAAVQHHLAQNPPAADAPMPAQAPRFHVPVGLLTFCIVQAAIATIAWRLLFS
jgi:hypothetical protein